eukprot:4609955-Amphidinium_carterae.1
MAKATSCGQTSDATPDSGKKVNSMASEYTFQRLVPRGRVNGKRGSDCIGWKPRVLWAWIHS